VGAGDAGQPVGQIIGEARLPAGPIGHVGEAVEAVEKIFDDLAIGINQIRYVAVGIHPVLDQIAVGIAIARQPIVGVILPLKVLPVLGRIGQVVVGVVFVSRRTQRIRD